MRITSVSPRPQPWPKKRSHQSPWHYGEGPSSGIACRPVFPVQPWGPGLHPTPLNWEQPTPFQDLRELGTARTRHRTRRLRSAQEASAIKFNLSPRGQSCSWLPGDPAHMRLWAAWRTSEQGLEADMCLSTGTPGAVPPALTTAAVTAATGQSGESRAHHHLPPSPRVLLANPSLSFKTQDTPPPTGTSFPLGTYSSRKGCSGKSPSPLPGSSVCVSPTGLQAAAGQDLPPSVTQLWVWHRGSSRNAHRGTLLSHPMVERCARTTLPMGPAQDQPYPENAGLCSPPQGMRKEGSDRSMVTMLEETGGKAWPRNAWLQSLSYRPSTQLSGGGHAFTASLPSQSYYYHSSSPRQKLR